MIWTLKRCQCLCLLGPLGSRHGERSTKCSLRVSPWKRKGGGSGIWQGSPRPWCRSDRVQPMQQGDPEQRLLDWAQAQGRNGQCPLMGNFWGSFWLPLHESCCGCWQCQQLETLSYLCRLLASSFLERNPRDTSLCILTNNVIKEEEGRRSGHQGDTTTKCNAWSLDWMLDWRQGYKGHDWDN